MPFAEFAHKCAHLTHELEASSSKSKILIMSAPPLPEQNAIVKLTCLGGPPLTLEPTMREILVLSFI